MNNSNTSKKINKYIKFWNREKVKLPIIGFWIGSYLPLQLFRGSQNLKEKSKLSPPMINFSNFIKDYEEFFLLDETLDDDLIRVGQVFWGIPWMETILGCSAKSSSDTIWAETNIKRKEELSKIKFDNKNLWFNKLIEFEKKLVEKFGDSHPIGTTVMRGPADILSTFLSQEGFVMAIYDNSSLVSEVLSKITEYWIKIAEAQLKYIPPYNDGYGIGLFNLWAPKRAVWFQEDAISVLSPDIYKEFIFKLDKRISKSFEYIILHLHTDALHSIEKILEIEELNAIEVNIDINTTVKDKIPIFEEILKHKSLLLWGLERKEDIELILNCLDSKGLMINITTPSVEKALEIKEIFFK